ncbi:hypothetical protein FE257_002820 [Aspergillus nanangensis]|uniref:Uncharacterized protein n=1 Tax=Aspergillus nanangensis TaxID=2582783 RepID=A0AAD4GN41_ASPNN|nr:hypothetical protein FE257_002820 [Aspergillus nanangensis]
MQQNPTASNRLWGTHPDLLDHGWLEMAYLASDQGHDYSLAGDRLFDGESAGGGVDLFDPQRISRMEVYPLSRHPTKRYVDVNQMPERTSCQSGIGDGAANACASLENYCEDCSSLGGHEALGLYVDADHVARITSCRSSRLDCRTPVPTDRSNQSQPPRASRPSQIDSEYIMNSQGLSGDEHWGNRRCLDRKRVSAYRCRFCAVGN